MPIIKHVTGRDAVDDDTYFGILASEFDTIMDEPFAATLKKTTWEYMSIHDPHRDGR